MGITSRLLWIACMSCCWSAWASEKTSHLSCGVESNADGSVSVQEATLHGVPAILRKPAVVTQPPVILWHGFGGPASPADLMRALPLDDVPAVKVYLWLPLFGPRAPAGGSEELTRRQTQDYVMLLFEPAVIGAAKELPAIVDELRARQCLGTTDAIDLFGFSAGGSAVLYTLIEKRVRVRAAMIVNAPPNLDATISALERATGHSYQWSPSSRRIARSADAVRHAHNMASGDSPPALLIFQGADDSVIAKDGALSLEQALRPYYHALAHDERLQTAIEQGISHKWTDPPAVEVVRTRAGAWFRSIVSGASGWQ
jgi:predicted esterase